MSKEKKRAETPATPKKRNPECLEIDNRYFRPKDAERILAAREAGGEKLAEFNTGFDQEMTARVLSMPEVKSARVIQRYEGDLLDINYQADELRRLTAEVHGGNMERPEAMLVAQAHTLDSMFCSLTIRSHANMGMGGGHLEAADRYLRLALKAQAQCRATIETLATLKNPPVVFARNANVVNGHQQVNQTITPSESFRTSTCAPAHAEKTETKQNELLEADHGKRMDSGAQRTAESLNSAMAALEPVNRTAHR